ncbi:TonB-dependent receptor [Mucilaginibacter paludis]|uniref:TonB-dependent receptor n=1 Tax=Mucilaginibacter paludis DSM 18603 TaxID=714943 RepID=H1YEL2_9SPHI|nr:TonB-dependent receptor [Mucilaginibacter paludis]EHQ30772.1 TonB-dependent receptor [Mucilaginibacter paludis DSM 18603]
MSYHYLFKKIALPFLFVLFLATAVNAQIIKGKITDRKNGEPLPGATVELKQGIRNLYAPVNLDGSYQFKNLRPGIYLLQVKFVGFKTSITYTVEAKAGVTTVNVSLVDDLTSLTEINVTEKINKESDGAARSLEKSSNNIENILSSNTIQLLPDVTVGNALQRMSGVTIQRSTSGEGRYAIIRGMDQRYNTVLVNGIKIPSPDDQYRFVPLDIFPSEILERLEVIKALTPNMEGDAIGGVMNLVMKSAPDRLLLNVNASAGYSFLFSGNRPFDSFNTSSINKQSPAEINGNSYISTTKDYQVNSLYSTPKSNPVNSTLGITIGDRFLNHKLGVVVSGSYQNFYRGSNSTYLVPNAEPGYSPANTPSISNIYNRKFSTQTERVGLHNKIDYVFNSKNKISLYNLYVKQNEYQDRFTADSDLITTTSKQGITYRTLNRTTWTYQNLYNSTLQGEHQLTDKLKFNWNGVYSIAKRNMPDQVEYQINHTGLRDTHGNIDSTTNVAASISHKWQHNTDQDVAGYYNFIYNPKIVDRDVELSFGGLYRHKTRSNYYASYSLTANPPNQVYNGNLSAIQLAFNQAGQATGDGASSTDGNDYTFHENVTGEYLQTKFMLLDKLQIIGGVRVENTAQDYATTQSVNTSAQNGRINYTDVLPSANLKYALSDVQNLRLSYFKSISRPSFSELAPTKIAGDTYDQVGNPELQHTRAENYDFRYELFPGGSNQLLLGAFYKDIQNPIELINVNGASAQSVFKTGAPSLQYIQPQNTDKATNYGFEGQLTKYFGVLGISANYTFTQSKVTTPKLSKVSAVPIYVNETRPLQGQAKNIANLSLLFKSSKIGLDMQLAYVFTGERIAQVSNYADLDVWQKQYNQVDFSFEKVLIKKLSFYGKVNNLTNASNRLFLKHSSTVGQVIPIPAQDNAEEILIQKDIYKVSFLTGLRYKF